MLPWFSFAFLLLPLVLVLILQAIKAWFIPPSVRSYKHAADICRLLNPGPHIPLGDLLHARASPNRRLIDAFELSNTFVSDDTKIHRSFTTRAKALIAGGDDKNDTWRVMALNAETSAHRYLPTSGALEFATLIQCITFSVVLSALFHTNPEALRYDDVVHATQIINQRWKDSKIKDAAALRQDGSLSQLIAYLDQWMVVDHDQSSENGTPLNFILPAFETMWRVVAVTVAYAYRSRDDKLHDTVVAFGRDLTEERFVAFGEDGRRPSMESIVREVLRLHPPTRHIARVAHGPTHRSGPGWLSRIAGFVAPGPNIEIADIEGVHRSEEYGENTSDFDPMRFHPSRMSKRVELFAFGCGRLKCVAAGWAPMAAAVIAATIVLQIEEAGLTVTIGPNIGGRSGWEGWTVCKGEERL